MEVEAALRMNLAQALDPVVFARRVAGFEPDPWQLEVLRSNHSRICLNCCRQSGKSTIAAVMALHTALYKEPALVLLLSPSLRQSSELFRKVLGLYRTISTEAPSQAESALRLEFPSGSRIISLPGKEATVRGYSGVDLLVVDEAARTGDELYRSVRPMLAVSEGRLALLSTPFGKRGFFYETWVDGNPEWLRIRVKAEECPRISKEFLEEERQTLGPWWFSQEYCCTFEEAETSPFGAEFVRAAFSEDCETWDL